MYYKGLLENIFLAGKYFPDWKVYVYLAPDVTPNMRQWLEACSSVVIRDTGIVGPENMIHRFYAIDEPDVEIMMVRDADSRIHWKDRWAIREFVKNPQFIAHTVRDNVVHTALLMGGLWGLRKSAGINIHEEYEKSKSRAFGYIRMGHDQNFLGECIYPLVRSRLLVHYAFPKLVFPNENAYPFPFKWTNDVYCGRVEIAYIDYPEPPKHVPTNVVDSLPVVKTRVF